MFARPGQALVAWLLCVVYPHRQKFTPLELIIVDGAAARCRRRWIFLSRSSDSAWRFNYKPLAKSGLCV